jgi:hypothetical protein
MARGQARFAIALARAPGEVARVRRWIDLGAQHQDVHLEEQRVQLLIAGSIDQRLGWEQVRSSRPKAARLREVERHLRTDAPLSDAQTAVPS